jgi:hypothetical protein
MAALHGAGPQTAGMLRISKGQEERHVWPVHLPGWLAIGWRVAGAAYSAAIEVSADVEAEHERESHAKPASNRGRRGRKSREELDQPAPDDVVSLAQSSSPAAEEVLLSALPEGLLDEPLI